MNDLDAISPTSYVGKLFRHHLCIDAYKEPRGLWLDCPSCGLQPKVWIFNNGNSTACGCGNSQYDHFSIHSESILSVLKRCRGNTSEYNSDDLRTNWNHWCETGEVLFEHACKRFDGRW